MGITSLSVSNLRRDFVRVIAITVTGFIVCAVAAHGYVPKEGIVPDAETAVRIAEVILIPIYGKEDIERQRPFKAILRKRVWHIEGSLPEGLVGGVARVEIAKRDGRIISVEYDK